MHIIAAVNSYDDIMFIIFVTGAIMCLLFWI